VEVFQYMKIIEITEDLEKREHFRIYRRQQNNIFFCAYEGNHPVSFLYI